MSTSFCLKMGVLYFSLYLIALGTGGLKSRVSGFGTDQFDEKGAKEKLQMSYFFSRFFFVIGRGILMAVTVLVYIQDEVGRSWRCGICSVSLFIAILIFLSGTRRYRYKKCMGSHIVHICQAVAAAIKKRKVELHSNTTSLYEDYPKGVQNPAHISVPASVVTKGDYSEDGSIACNPWMLCPVTRVEEVKMVIRLLPIWAATILFWSTYAQMIKFSVEQPSTMKRTIGHFKTPAGSLTVFFVAAILIILGAYDRLIIPILKKWKGKPGFSNLQLIAIGLFLSALGMTLAAVVEVKCLSVSITNGTTTTRTTLPISLLFDSAIFLGGFWRRVYIHLSARFLHHSNHLKE